MCGIAGEVSFVSSPPEGAWVQRACERMQHRGPDGEGLHREGPLALGHRRLSVIDVAGGAQPMSYAKGRYWITYNGEIYNYRALRDDLRALGFGFQTDSDTEVVLAAWAAWGLGALPRLNGIFAFGIWDRQRASLCLARDPLGVKPLLYHCDARGVVFASELKALLAHPRIAAEVDPEGLQDFLALGYTLTPRSIVDGVRKLPAGTSLLLERAPASPQPYWEHLENAAQTCAPGAEAAQAADFEAALQTSVTEQMVSDVPLGTFLSGGIDSSTISYYAARETSTPIETFSMGFQERSFDESNYARQVADAIGSVHHGSCATAPRFEELEKLAWLHDEPLGDTSILPTASLARLAREHVTVALSGDGADEILAGYDTYVADRLHAIYARVPRWLHRGLLLPAARRIPPRWGKVGLDFKIRQFLEHAEAGPEAAHFGWRSMFSETESRELSGYTGPHRPFDSYAAHYAKVPGADALQRSLYVDLKTWLVDDILTKVDRASMACGLEVRVPFLAPELVLQVMQIPSEFKLRGFQRKYLLERLMRGRLPRAVLRRRKRGFNAPVSHWFRGELREGFDAIVHEANSGIVDLRSPLVRRLWEEHRAGQRDHGFRLWNLFSLVLWERSVLARA